METTKIIEKYAEGISDLIYNFQLDACKYLDYEQQRAINEFKKKILEKIKEESK